MADVAPRHPHRHNWEIAEFLADWEGLGPIAGTEALDGPWTGYTIRHAPIVGWPNGMTAPVTWAHGLLVDVLDPTGARVAVAFFAEHPERPDGAVHFFDDIEPRALAVALYVAEAVRGRRLSDTVGAYAERVTGRVIAEPQDKSGFMHDVWPRRRGWGGASPRPARAR